MGRAPGDNGEGHLAPAPGFLQEHLSSVTHVLASAFPGMSHTSTLLLATGTRVLRVDPTQGTLQTTRWPDDLRPTCLAVDPHRPGRAWAGTTDAGVLRSDDGGRSWTPTALTGVHVTSLAASPAAPDRVWAGTEPSALWGSRDGGDGWDEAKGLGDLPSSSEWSFPPKPETHHVRWIACRPGDPGRLWLAIEAGALVTTPDGGVTWTDRVPEGPWDTHELAIHPDRPDHLRVAAGDGYLESPNGGREWVRPDQGLGVGYFRSVAVDPGDPEVVILSGATRPKSTYVAGRSDGRVYRREGKDPWKRILDGWPDPPHTIAPLIRPGHEPGGFWAADERGVHRSGDGGWSWEPVASFGDDRPHNLRGLALLPLGG